MAWMMPLLFNVTSVPASMAVLLTPVVAMVPELVTLTAPLDFNTAPPLVIVPVTELFTVSRPSVTIAMLLA